MQTFNGIFETPASSAFFASSFNPFSEDIFFCSGKRVNYKLESFASTIRSEPWNRFPITTIHGYAVWKSLILRFITELATESSSNGRISRTLGYIGSVLPDNIGYPSLN